MLQYSNEQEKNSLTFVRKEILSVTVPPTPLLESTAKGPEAGEEALWPHSPRTKLLLPT